MSPLLESLRLNQIKKYIVGNDILDFGCGYGKLATDLSKYQYIGVDIDDGLIDSAKIINTGRKNSKFYYLSEFQNMDVKFDTIILAAVIEHMDDPVHILMELESYLRNGGRMIITTPTPNANKVLWIGSRLKLFSRDALDDHKCMLTKQDFVNIADNFELDLLLYDKFELGLNQIIVYQKR